MRPAILDPLFSPVASLPGVGPKLADLLARVTGREDADDCRVVDLLFHAPASIIDRRNRPGIALASQGAIVTIEGRVDRHQPPPRGKPNMPYRVFLHDDTGELALTFFRV
ncbi:MAG TPA: ATP-dependent DNA helicase RecG, partial [Pseudorhizobium sp.]|nr:ATP-dependent DNA helicase RecG [Pseudorhizobium sp.]